MKPYKHARSSAQKYGGVPEDYLEIHNFFDQTKAHIADVRHRAILHNAFGIFLAERMFGEVIPDPKGGFMRTSYITNSAGRKVQVRDIGEDHVLQDLGRIPSLNDSIQHLPMLTWLGGQIKKTSIQIVD